MQSYEVYVCLISAQATPNLVPILNMNPRPKTVLLMVTEAMTKQAAYFQEVLKTQGIHNVHQIALSDSYDLDSIKNQTMDLLDQQNLLDQWDKVAVNITGGTKLMSLATYLVFDGLGGKCFYFTEQNQWIELKSGASEAFGADKQNSRRSQIKSDGCLASTTGLEEPEVFIGWLTPPVNILHPQG